MKAKTQMAAHGCALAMAVSIAHAEVGKAQRSFQDHEVVMDKELLITAPEVVDSKKSIYPGPWSFGYLMEQAFTEEKAPEVVAQWLTRWMAGNEKAGVPARSGVNELIRGWRHQDGHQATDGEWRPNLANAPFRLLAIVNRMDLSLPMTSLRDERGKVENLIPPPTVPYYNGSGSGSLLADASAGEGRFVFAVVDSDGEVQDGGTTLILEYGLATDGSQDEVLNWAMDWHALGKHEAYDGSYLAALAGVTGKFTRRLPKEEGNQRNRFGRGTGLQTQLLRIRINDGSFGATREFREFGLTSDGLNPNPLAGTPRAVFFEKGTRENRWLARWLRKEQLGGLEPANSRAATLREPLFNMAFPATVELRGQTIPVVAMAAPVPENNASYHWDAYAMSDRTLRRTFSMQTCCGCHCGDTETAFFHVEPRQAGKEAKLSSYLRIDGEYSKIKDPGSKRQVKLQEMEERRMVFESFLNPKLSGLTVRKIRERRLERAH